MLDEFDIVNQYVRTKSIKNVFLLQVRKRASFYHYI
jgi:hypothetical protein